jgi:hypothetical protein
MEAGIYAGMKLRLASKTGGLVIDATSMLGGDQPPAIYSWGRLTTAGNLLNLICQDLLPEESPRDYGTRWILTGEDGREFDNIHSGDKRLLKDVGLHENMRLAIRQVLSASLPDPAEQIELADVPEILRQPLSVRRERISETQNKILVFIRDHGGNGDMGVRQEQITGAFKDLGDGSTIFYRLEVLCLMGLIDKRAAGQENGVTLHVYSLSKAYRTMLRKVELPNSPSSSVTFRRLDRS